MVVFIACKYKDWTQLTVMPTEGREQKSIELKSVFNQIDRYIRENYADRYLQRLDVLEHFCISCSILNQMMNDYAGGMSFPSYVNQIRLDIACSLLRSNRNMKIAEIAESVGLTTHNLHHLFKARYQLTPAEFRKRKL